MDTIKKYRILSAELKFLKKELEVVEGLMNDATIEFNKKLMSIISKTSNLKAPGTKSKSEAIECHSGTRRQAEESDPNPQEEEVEVADSNQRVLFKKIASKSHPDKLSEKSEFEKKFKTKLFERARRAIEENDYFSLTEVAEELEIVVPPPEQEHIENIIATRDKVRKRTNLLKNTYPWVWYFEKDENKKSAIMKDYMDKVKESQ